MGLEDHAVKGTDSVGAIRDEVNQRMLEPIDDLGVTPASA